MPADPATATPAAPPAASPSLASAGFGRARLALAALLVLAGAAVCVFAPAPVHDNRPTAWVPPADPLSQAYADFVQRFGGDEVQVLRLSAPDPVALGAAVADWHARLAGDPAVERVLSARSLDEDALAALLDPDLTAPAERPALLARFAGPLSQALQLWSPDGRHAVLYAFGRVVPPAERAPLVAAVATGRAAPGGPDPQGGTEPAVRAAGNPLLNVALDDAARSLDTTTLPALVAVCVLVLLALTRSARLTALTLLPLGLAVLTADRLIDLAGRPHNLVVGIVRPLLFVLLLASAVHLVNAWQAARRQGAPAVAAAAEALRHKGGAVALALFTTSLGFGSLALSALTPIRDFGLAAAAGLIYGGALMLAVLPILLATVGRAARVAPAGGSARLAVWAVTTGLRHRRLAPAVGLLVLVGGAAAWPHLRQDPHAIRYFASDHPLRLDHEALTAAGVGLASAHLVVTAPTHLAAGQLRPDSVAGVQALTDAAAALPGVRAALSPSLLLREARYQIDGAEGLPQGTALGEALAHAEVTAFVRGDALRLTLLIDSLDAPALRGLEAALHAAVAAHLPGATARFTGSYGLVLAAQESLLATLLGSLGLTALLMGLVLLVALRSVALGLAAMVPNLVPVAFNFGLMALVGLPLDVGTAMTAAVALGIAVDDTLHLSLAWDGAAPLAAARTTGRALVGSSLIIGLGFLALLPADFGPTRNFGLLCAVAMLTALAADLLVLPPLLARLRPPAHKNAMVGRR